RAVGEAVVSRYDHSFMIRRTPESEEVIEVLGRHFSKIYAVDWQPTCENMVRHFAELIRPRLPEGIRLVGLKLHETATSYAELTF
ncbi:MAG: 6-carboxytetrahydropterin synthase, partial [Tidjanibacter sp.]|nr:6-carboxytetrahydropterin synthase [Tidjanibacter sp.]